MLKKIASQLILGLILLTTMVAPINAIWTSGGVSLQPAVALAQNSAAEDALQSTYALPVCFNLSEGFSVIGCTGQLLYWALWWPTQWLAARAGGFLDYFIFFSIDSNTYRGVPFEDANGNPTSFILEGWRIVRDISNILFIFGLIYIAFAFVLRVNIGNANPKKLLVYLIVMALLINFSLFFARVITDAGNILARTMYNQINLVNRSASADDLTGPDGVKSIGLMLISLSNPQALMSQDHSNATSFSNVETESNLFVMMTVGAIIFNVFLIYIFVSVAVYFIARIIGLYYSMIFAPFAFASMAIPKGSSIQYIGFTSWFGNLVNYSFLAPLFIFFLYLTIKFLDVGIPINPNVSGSSSLAQTFMTVLIPFALAIGFLVLGKSIAKKMSGRIGEATSKVVTSAVAGAAGVAVGAAAIGARQTVGRAAKAIGSSSNAKNFASTGKGKLFGKEVNLGKAGRLAGKATVYGGNRLGRQTFDARQGKASRAAGRIMSGVAGAAGGSVPNINTGLTTKAGGFAGYEARKKEEQNKLLSRREEELQLTPTQAAKQNKAVKERNENLKPELAQEYESAKAAAESSLIQSEVYKNASNLKKERLVQAARNDFDKKYKKGEVIVSYDNKGKASTENRIQKELDVINAKTSKELSFDKLTEKLKKSDFWKKATQTQRDQRLIDLQKTFERSYAKGEVITGVNDQGIASSQNKITTAANDTLIEKERLEKKKQLAEKYTNEEKYKRLESSIEVDNRRTKMFGLEQAERTVPMSRSKTAATKEFGYKTIKKVGGDTKSQEQIKKLTNNLDSLNDTLGSYYHLSKEGMLEGTENKDLSKITSVIDNTQKEAALKKLQSADPRTAEKQLRDISASLSARMTILDADIRRETSKPDYDETKINELARIKQQLKVDQRRIEEGLEGQAKIMNQITNARK